MNKNKIKASLEYLAAGDALGYMVEFLSWQEIQKTHGKSGITMPFRWLAKKSTIQYQATVSDDTQMTLFLLEALLDWQQKNGQDELYDVIKNGFIQWLDTQQEHPHHEDKYGNLFNQCPELHRRRVPGNTCLSAMNERKGGNGNEFINNSKGCGAVMRAAPCGWMPGWTPEEAYQIGVLQGKITHGHVDGWECAGLLAAAVNILVNEQGDIKQAFEKALEIGEMKKSDTHLLLRKALNDDRKNLDPDQMTKEYGEGWTGESALALAVYACRNAPDVHAALGKAVNHSGDSDSVGAIAGAIWGAWKGMDERYPPINFDVSSGMNMLMNRLAPSVGMTP